MFPEATVLLLVATTTISAARLRCLEVLLSGRKSANGGNTGTLMLILDGPSGTSRETVDCDWMMITSPNRDRALCPSET